MALTERQQGEKDKHIRYWRNREEEQKKHNVTDEKAYEEEMARIHENMLDNCQKEINAFYGRYASREGITLAEAKKRVSELDIKAYERKAKRYVKEKNFSKEANDEMRLYNLTMKVNRLEMLKANIGLELISGYDELQKFMGDILQGRTEDELERQAGILGKTIRNNSKAAESIVNASFHNAKFSDRIWMYQDLLKNELDSLLQSGLIAGKNPRVLAREIEKRFDVKKSAAERLMRTELARVQTEAQKQAYERNGFEMYTFIALGDACPICKNINKKHFNIEDMMPGLNAPPMHPHCRCSTAAYEDSDEYEAWLDYLDNGGTTEDWNKFAKKEWRELEKSVEDDILEPEDKGDLFTDPGHLSDNLEEASLQVHLYLNELGLPDSKWSGNTVIKTPEEMDVPGRKKVNCDIWLREDATTKNIIHEHLHARSISRFPEYYGKLRFIEEATVELLAEEICKKNDIGFTPTYARRTSALREIIGLLERDDEYAFAIELFMEDVTDRRAWLNDAISEYCKKHKIKGRLKKEEFEKAMNELS